MIFFIENSMKFLPDNYFVQTIETDPLYALNFAKPVETVIQL